MSRFLDLTGKVVCWLGKGDDDAGGRGHVMGHLTPTLIAVRTIPVCPIHDIPSHIVLLDLTRISAKLFDDRVHYDTWRRWLEETASDEDGDADEAETPSRATPMH